MRYLLPLKALVADKRRHFEAVYGAFGLRVIEATGETDDVSPIYGGNTTSRCSRMKSSRPSL